MKKLIIIFALLPALALLFSACSDNPANPPDETLAKLTCVECHTDQARLQALATDEPPPNGEAGEG